MCRTLYQLCHGHWWGYESHSAIVQVDFINKSENLHSIHIKGRYFLLISFKQIKVNLKNNCLCLKSISIRNIHVYHILMMKFLFPTRWHMSYEIPFKKKMSILHCIKLLLFYIRKSISNLP